MENRDIVNASQGNGDAIKESPLIIKQWTADTDIHQVRQLSPNHDFYFKITDNTAYPIPSDPLIHLIWGFVNDTTDLEW